MKEKYVLNAKREIFHLSKLNHQNIIRLIEYSDENKQVFIVLHFAKDGDLHEFLQGKPSLTEVEKLVIVFQIARGILHFHGHGIIHRDLKPKNILIDGWIMKIGDFGLSRDVGNKQGIKPDTT